jgi:uncharacterized protein
MFIRIALLTVLTAFATTTQAVSFDCQKAKTFTEKAICQDPELSAVDDELSALYLAAEERSKNPKALKKEQEKWLKSRDTCQTNVCVKKSYQKRIIDLTPE